MDPGFHHWSDLLWNANEKAATQTSNVQYDLDHVWKLKKVLSQYSSYTGTHPLTFSQHLPPGVTTYQSSGVGGRKGGQGAEDMFRVWV